MATSQDPRACRRQFCRGQRKEQEGEEARRRDGKITSRNGREWGLAIPWGQRKTGKGGKVLLQRHRRPPRLKDRDEMGWAMTLVFDLEAAFSKRLQVTWQSICHQRSATGHGVMSIALSSIYQWLTRLCEIQDTIICRRLYSLQKGEDPPRLPRTPEWPRQASRLGKKVAEAPDLFPASKSSPLLHLKLGKGQSASRVRGFLEICRLGDHT